MISAPPGEPTTSRSLPFGANTSVGDIELRGRLPGSTRFATGRPSCSGRNEKSVSSLLSRKPSTISREPNSCSMVVVMATASPAASTIERWLVEGRSKLAPSPHKLACDAGGTPGSARQRHGQEIAVGEVAVAVGIGKARRLREEVQALRGHGLQTPEIEALEHAQDL